jgi:Fe2+ or Zn2+ uptake regulation protein
MGDFPHAHFFCTVCNKIIDVDLNIPIFHKQFIRRHKINEVNVHFRGICRNCLEEKKKNPKMGYNKNKLKGENR